MQILYLHEKGRKAFNMIAGYLMILASIIFIVLPVIFYITDREFGFYTLLGILLIPLLFLAFGITAVVTAAKKVCVYKGRVVYHTRIINKEYRMSDIKVSKTQSETYSAGLHYENSVPAEGYDKVTTFYNENGKKIFKFGSAFDNVQLLVKDVINTQKSISKNHRKS